ncbi:MAG: D-alanyl-D-alanine carboxypeptidase [Aphanothece sp. CMT-3BRIN-NPC111]|jgi:D-alanyl-D-alanine carboxypeptidase/D-alanyl-D-alanine-endopeptidase (penicillin-binding protein 4)|nr:D-alanyl-D-alanine carboxypeptidase [Aphanothece sp. CMT-3BRIN-NPC111]
MLQLFSSGLMALWLDMAGMKPANVNATEMLAWQGIPLFSLPTGPDPVVESTVQQYLRELSARGMETANQGVWMQSGPALLTARQGTVPRPAASLTKVATTLAALETWGPAHQFETLISTTGPVQNGVLQGDLVITGNGDPFFVWEEAIALGNALNQMGIRGVAGNLVMAGDFYMNYQFNPEVAGQLLKQGLNSATWPPIAATQYLRMPQGTPRPQVAIAGGVQIATFSAPKQILLLRHRSMQLTQILKEMNIYSNNEMAEMLAKSLGGAQVVSQLAANSAGFSPQEIQLLNGSGLGVGNQISPHAVCNMLIAIQRYLQPHNLTIADLFPVSGRDRRGTLETRQIPNATVIKTGTLNDVSALAGVMPTRDRGLVWFTIINRGPDIEGLRAQQDQLLQRLLQRWGVHKAPPIAIAPSTGTTDPSRHLGDPSRNEIMTGIQAQFSN